MIATNYKITFPLKPAKTREKTRENTREKIIAFVKEIPDISMKELADKIGISQKGIEWQMRKLKQEGILKRVGSDKTGHWEVKK